MPASTQISTVSRMHSKACARPTSWPATPSSALRTNGSVLAAIPYLYVPAALSLSFASLSSIVILLRQMTGGTPSPHHVLLFRLVLESRLTNAAASVLPPLLALFGLDPAPRLARRRCPCVHRHARALRLLPVLAPIRRTRSAHGGFRLGQYRPAVLRTRPACPRRRRGLGCIGRCALCARALPTSTRERSRVLRRFCVLRPPGIVWQGWRLPAFNRRNRRSKVILAPPASGFSPLAK